MPDDRFDALFGGIDVPVRPDPGFEAALLERLLDELECEATAPTVLRPAPRRRWRPPADIRLGTAAALVALAAAAVALLLVTRGQPAQAESALAVMRQARSDAAQAPPFDALIVVRRPLGDDVVPGERRRTDVTRLRWADDRHWRREVLSTTGPDPPVAGASEVRDGALIGAFTPGDPGLFEVRRGRRIELGDEIIRPEVGALRIPEGQTFAGFFDDQCTVLRDTRVAGRPGRQVACRHAGSRTRFWVDARTGLVLRISVPSLGYRLDVRRIAYRPDSAPSTFDVAPPSGARLRWLGPGVAPPRYRTAGSGGPRLAVVAVGREPADVAVGDGVAWVAVAGERRVRSFDAGTLARGPEASVPGAALTTDTTGVWVVDEIDATLTRIGGSGAAAARTDLGGAPQGVAAGLGSVWVADYEGGPAGRGTLVRADPVSARATARIAVGSGPERVAVGRGAVWVTNSFDGSVSRVDPARGREVARIPVSPGVPESPEAGLADVAVGAGGVWVTTWPGAGRGTLVRIDPRTNAVSARIRVGTGPNRVTTAGGRVWVTNAGDDTVAAVDPATRRVVSTVRTGGRPGAVASGGGAVWVVNAGEGTLARLRP